MQRTWMKDEYLRVVVYSNTAMLITLGQETIQKQMVEVFNSIESKAEEIELCGEENLEALHVADPQHQIQRVKIMGNLR